MVKLYETGAYLLDGQTLVPASEGFQNELKNRGVDEKTSAKETAAKETMAYKILEKHNTNDNMDALKIKFDKMTSHDITFVGIIQTARASGLKEFPIPYVLTNCHNSLCAVGGTINEDDHVFGLSCAKRYGGIYVPPHQAVIHQYAREMLAECGAMILGSDSHTRYGALGTMAIGEGGGELAKQLLGKTYDVARPGVVAIYLDGEVAKGVGPQDVALAIIGEVFGCGYVKNKVMEFVGPGIKKLSADFRIGIDVMTTETTCLSSIWETDEEIEKWYETHYRPEAYKELHPGKVAYYDGVVYVDLSKIKPMIAMPFHPSNTYTIEELKANLTDILHDVEEQAKKQLTGDVEFKLTDKIRDGKLYVEQGIIAGCAGGGYENICEATDILRGHYIGSEEFTLSVYPASTPIMMQLAKNGMIPDLLETGAIVKTAFCGPCFGAGDTPRNGALSIRHSTRNFPNREGSKIQNGQIASVALMDARSIAATAVNKGYLTAATELDVEYTGPKYFFDKKIYDNRVYNGFGKADSSVDVVFGPNIKDWPEMPALTEHLLLKFASVIHDPVTTTDELIPSGETSSFRSNPIGLAEFTLSRKDPEYVGRAKEIHEVEIAREKGEHLCKINPEIGEAVKRLKEDFPDVKGTEVGVGSTIFAVKPGDGSAREQAASCQKVLGGWANVAKEYATKRYRSNLINWGMLPFVIEKDFDFETGDFLFIPNVKKAVAEKTEVIKGYVVNKDMAEVELRLGELTDDERKIIDRGCLINFYRD